MPAAQPPKWHPLQSLREPQPGHWELFDQQQRKYGDIAFVRREGNLGYRCIVLSPHPTVPADIGIVPTLREAAERVHGHWVAGHSGERDLADERRAAQFRMLPPGISSSLRRTWT